MILDFLYKKIRCTYCENQIKRKDAVLLEVMVKGKIVKKQLICFKCAEMIQCLQQASRAIKEREYLSQFAKPKWAIKQIIRYDRGILVEDICKHGIGHPNKVWYEKYGKDGDGVHGCDGCCTEKEKPKLPDTPPIQTIDSALKEEKKKSLKKTSKKIIKKEKKTKTYSAEPLKIVKL